MRQLGLLFSTVVLFAITALPLPVAAAIGTPLQPILAWEVAPDGAVYVLDAAQRVYELDPATLAPVRVSARLGPLVSDAGAQIVATSDRIFVASPRLEGIQVLERATLDVSTPLAVDAVALAAESAAPGGRLFIIQRQAQTQFGGLSRYTVVTLPLADLQAEPEPFGPTAAEPFSSLFDLAVDQDQHLLYVGYTDTSGSPNRHYRTYNAYDLQTGQEVDLPIEHQSASTALRPVTTPVGLSAISYDWLGFEPSQHRIYLVSRGDAMEAGAQAVEGLSGPLALDATGTWLYLVRPRGLWVLEHSAGAAFTLASVVPFVTDPPTAGRLSPDGATLYLFGNGWLSAQPTADLQSGGIEEFGPFPSAWLGQADATKQMARRYVAADNAEADNAAADEGAVLVNLLPSGEWYRSADSGRTWQLLPAVQNPQDLGLDRLSLSPTMAQDQVAVARGKWGADLTRTTWRSLDAGATWESWAAPIAYAAGSEGAHTLYVADADGSQPRAIPNGGSSENPSWSPGWTHLAFQNSQSGDWEIYRTPADCGDLPAGPSQAASVACVATRLTDSAGDDLLPAWSPDGRMIAFVSQRDGNPEIYVMLADGSQQTRLTFAPGGDWRPAWLPDSRHLVFTSDRYGSNDIFLLSVPDPLSSGGDKEPPLTPVVAGPADQRDPAVNGENEMVFLSGPAGVLQPYSANLTRYLEAERSGRTDASADIPPSTGTVLFDDVEQSIVHPGWLPDGRLLFAMAGGIYAAAPYASQGDFAELVSPTQGALHPAAGPAWYQPPLTSYLADPISAR